MITKNNEKHISNCLENMKKIVDEIVIVDIGSTDLTINIARQAGANVHQIEWNNNYSEAKNFCLDRAKGRWVLFLQANETISIEQLKEIDSLLNDPNAEGYLLYIDHPWENYQISSPVQSLRLFRNRKEYRYQYRIFERIPDEILSNVKDTSIRIVQQNDENLCREAYSSVLLLEEELKEYPENCYLQYMYGIELLNQQRYEESIVYFQKACKNLNLDYLFAPHLYKCLSWSLISLKRYNDALDVLEEGIKVFPFYTDILVLRCEIRMQLYQYEEAIRDLEISLKTREKYDIMVPAPEIGIPIILETLGEIHQEIFNYQQALVCYQQAYELNKTNYILLYKIGKLAKKVNSVEVLENLLKTAKEYKNLNQLTTLMDILLQQREYTQVLTHLEYLEALLDKRDQIESIKSFCYMMLGEMEEAELHFSAINENSFLYNHMLLKRIESYWLYNKWKEAVVLLKEMDRIKSIESPIKGLYHLLHNLLMKKELCYPILGEQEYEIVSTLLEDFLWLEQTEKAQLLLPLLLQETKEDQYIKLAEYWAKRDDYQTIERIFQCISNKQEQLKFKQKIIERLLYSEHIELAQKLMKLGDPQPLEALEYVLWSKNFTKKLKKWIKKIYQRNIGVTISNALTLQIPAKPNKALLAFYHSLGLTKNMENEGSFIQNDTDLTCTKIYVEIGNYYAKAEKRNETLSAYLRAIQWDPLNYLAQEKIKDMFHENPSQFNAFLEEKSWILEGNRFHQKQDFINYIIGLMHFMNQQFDQALTFFLKISEDEAIYSVIHAYIISSLWIMRKEEEAERWLDEQNRTAKFLSSFFYICKGYALYRLDEGFKQYRYSELIMMEKQRINNISFKECLLQSSL